MRVLVVDQDSTLLTAITQTLGEYFTIDAVTTKADCLDLVRLNDFEVIVAGERLEDGSGLELLGSLARSRPDMLRIFAAERERLKLLKGRLGPFGLFRTLSYPIEPRQLLAALSAAAGIEEEVEEIEAVEAPPPAPAPAPAARRAESTQTSLRAPAVTPSAAGFARTQGQAAAPAPSRAQASVSVSPAPASRVQASVPTSTPRASRAQASVASVAPAPARSPAQTSRNGGRNAGASPTASQRQAPRQPTPAALAAASKLDIVTRPKGFPLPSDSSPARSAFLVGAGVILVLGGLALSFKIFNTKDEPVAVGTNASALRTPHFPPEVVRLVADTEVAFQQDDFKTARTDVAALQQIAPDHPRLSFFESLLKRLEATTQGSKSGSGRSSRHTSAPTASNGTGTSGTPSGTPASGSSGASQMLRASSAPGFDTQRRQPDTARDTASAATTTGTIFRAASTFAGRTLDDSNAGTSAQLVAIPSQAMATPVPRRPGSAAAPSETQEARLIQHVAADYPPEAARKGVEGSVDVSFTISPQGKVSDITVTSAVPSDIFNRAAIAAVRRWKYEPKTVNGVPVEAHQQLRLQFKLDPRGG
jgi:TonB family protein